MKSCRWAAVLGLTGILAFSLPLNAMAEMERSEEIDEATWARLQDDVLEYDEVENLVEYYNPTYRQLVGQLESAAEPYEKTAEEWRKLADETESDARDIKDIDPFMYKVMQETVKGYRKAAEGYDKAVKSVYNNQSSRTGRRQLKEAMTYNIQSTMKIYSRLLEAREMMDTGVALAQAAYESAVTQRTLGMATDTDVQAAEKSVQSATGQLQTMDDQLLNIRQNLCILTGWDYSADIRLGEVPGPDLSKIETMDPEKDLFRAVGNNYTLIGLRDMSGKGDANRTAKFRLIDEAEAKVKTELESSYQAVLESRTAFEAANTALQSAQITMNGNDLKYQMGMLGRLEYLQLKMAYLQQKMEAKTAALNLTQAIENYGWVVQGMDNPTGG